MPLVCNADAACQRMPVQASATRNGFMWTALRSATRQHFLFKQGSYWIYKDVVSGRVDSCYVTKLDSSLQHNDEYTKIYQSLFVDMQQRPVVDPLSDSIVIGFALGKGGIAIRYNSTRFLEDKAFGLQLEYPFKMGRTSNTPDSCVVVNIITDTTLTGMYYLNVINCFSGKYNAPGNYAWSYINDSVGIIRISTYTDYSIVHQWELQRWHILK